MGTRPEIIKISSIIHQLKDPFIIFTGQHYDYNLSKQFFNELDLPKPNITLKLSKSNSAIQVGEIIKKLGKILPKINPDTVIVVGDTNTVLGASIAALKSGIPISHVEAGPRSFDWRMPEEHNRIQVDHISELLFAPSQIARQNLLKENVHGRIFVTGNTVIDAINKYADLSTKKSQIQIDFENFILMTLHRTENVDNKNTLSSIIKAITRSKENIIFPIHPHTLKKLHDFKLYSKLKDSKNIHIIPSVGYFDMLELMKQCSFIVTDSGGIQQEATSPKIRKRVLVTRKTTDSPEAVKAGVAEVIGINSSKISAAIKRTSENPKLHTKKTPYGNGNSGKKIIKIMKKYF